jgi:exopolyphosphatase / guanosine-5'-triphosphate,3'-diphosphate pyrophosphatase
MPTRTALPSVREVLRPFERLPVDFGHPTNVARLAIGLFDGTRALHKLGQRERLYLWHAALLHDIGYADGWQAHHKSSFRRIRSADLPGLGPAENLIVACVARYHRGAVPKDRHEGYGDLGERARSIVLSLSALLRLADGLDRGQVGRVETVAYRPCGRGSAELLVFASGLPEVELYGGRKKAGLFEEVFGVELEIRYAGMSESTS